MSKELEQLILSKSRPVQKEVKQLQKSELDRLIIEALIKEGASAGEVLEQAVVDVWNGKTPKRFTTFAELLVEDLQKKIGEPSSAKRVEEASPSDFWKEMKGSDTTSKADIKLNEYRISMKMGTSAPLFNFGPGDAQACLGTAIVLSKVENIKLLNEVKADLAKLETRIVRGPIRGLKAAVRQKEEIKGLTADEVFAKFTKDYRVDPEARERVKEELVDLIAIDTAEKLVDYAEKVLPETQDNLDAIGEKLFKALDPSANPVLQQKFYGEALTGRVKFDGLATGANKDQVAQWMLMTSEKGSIQNLPQDTNVDSLYDFYEIDDQFINFISKAAKFRARFKSDSVKRSLAGKEKKTGFYKIRAIITSEIKKSKDELKMLKAELNNILASKKQLQEELLKEGFLDKAKAILKKLIQGAEQVFNKVVSFIEENVIKIASQIQAAIEQVRNLLDNSTSVADLVKNMGISLEEYVNSFEGLENINDIKVKDVI